MSTLEDLYNGHICPADRFIKKGSEYHKLSQFLSQGEDKLLKTLSREERTLYESIFENRLKQEDILGKETFIDGFRLGAQIMLEILTEPDKQLI